MAERPKYVLFGTPRFAALALEELIRGGMPPLAVIANPDRPAGRKKTLAPPPVKKVAERADIPVLQPEKIDAALLEALKQYDADCFLVAAYGKILPAELLMMPRKGTLGIHPSLLPRYRGASPIQAAILEGEAATGVTLYLLDKEMDHGPVLGQETLVLRGTETYQELEEALAVMGGKLALALLSRYLAGELSPAPQDHAQATFTKKFRTEDGHVEIGRDEPEVIARKVRALAEEPGVYATKDGKRLKLLAVERRPEGWVATRIQWEGKTPHDAGLLLG